jgi:hypothetical protein
MPDIRNGGTNARPLDETIAQTGPGIPDEALLPGEELPDPVDQDTIERTANDLDAPRTSPS